METARSLPHGLSEHMYRLIHRTVLVYEREAPDYLRWCNDVLHDGFTEEDDGYHVLMMALHRLPSEIITRDHILLFKRHQDELRLQKTRLQALTESDVNDHM